MKQMGHNKTVILVTTGILLLSGIFFYTVHKSAENYRSKVSPDVVVEQTWELPHILREVSGIAFLEPDRIACVQDEKGTIFIYDLISSSIEKEIEFAGPGDFEGISLDGNTAYVLRSDGTIFRIKNFKEEPGTESFKTPFGSKNDVEGIYFDPKKKQLLLAPKARGLASKKEKGIYRVDVNTMEMSKEALVKMTFEEKIFDELKGRNKNRLFYPSEVIVHPETGNFLLLEAKKPHLLILSRSGEPLALHRLDPNKFPKPEGLTFDDSGNLYISNEGNPATIHRVTIKSN